MNSVDSIKASNDQAIYDVLIIGAGISGVGGAHYLQTECPGKSFVILESKDTFGGTWATHTYPGIRSDSDLYTFGYKFKPWMGKPIARAGAILEYMEEVIEDEGIRDKIRFRHKVVAASWCSKTQLWTIEAIVADAPEPVFYQAKFLWMCQGYYDHAKGYMPDFPGKDTFKGLLVHPQNWPDDIDYKDKKVVVIGSGATAATVIPEMAETAKHVTMLQRSPTYFWTGPNENKLASILAFLRVPKSILHKMVRWQILFFGKIVQQMSDKNPERLKKRLRNDIEKILGKDFDYEKHLTPAYRPWQQRVAYVPDGDLFKAMRNGKASIVTDHIETFTETGIQTKSGEHLDADIIVSATGFNLLFFGGIQFEKDGEPVDLPSAVSYRGFMLSGLPNLSYVFGYLRTSWTMRVDLLGAYVARLLNHMDKKGMAVVTPTLRESDKDMELHPGIKEEDFNAGYIKRGLHQFPRQGSKEPWIIDTSYYNERESIPNAPLEDGVLQYEPPVAASVDVDAAPKPAKSEAAA